MNITPEDHKNAQAILREHERQEFHKAWDKAFLKQVDDWQANSIARMDRQLKEMALMSLSDTNK